MKAQYQDQMQEIAIFAKNGNYDLSTDEVFAKMMQAWLYSSKELYNNREETKRVVASVIKAKYN